MLGGPAQAWCAVALKGTFCFISHWSLLCCAQAGGGRREWRRWWGGRTGGGKAGLGSKAAA